MTKLSVNINKIALLRNARGNDFPNLLQFALEFERLGAQGITVHPRPDQRHVRYDDIPLLKANVQTEFNIEGNPENRFMDLVLANRPHQCTLVPDATTALTSDAGWDTIGYADFLKDITKTLQENGIRVSIFVDPDVKMVEGAAKIGADRIELYTGNYAHEFYTDKEKAIKPYIEASKMADECGLGINAGHDLNLDNLGYLRKNIASLSEVSIGHALVVDCLKYGIHNTVQLYLRSLSSV